VNIRQAPSLASVHFLPDVPPVPVRRHISRAPDTMNLILHQAGLGVSVRMAVEQRGQRGRSHGRSTSRPCTRITPGATLMELNMASHGLTGTASSGSNRLAKTSHVPTRSEHYRSGSTAYCGAG
jgi:hypothetical protein